MFHARTESLQGTGTLILRLAVGFVLIAHGLQKALGFDGWADTVREMGIPMPELMAALALGAELGGGALIVLGLLTPLAAVFVFVNMMVAIVQVHLSRGLMAAEGGFEYPLVLAASAIFLLLHGPGPYSIDAWIAGHARRGRPGRPEVRRAGYGARHPAPT